MRNKLTEDNPTLFIDQYGDPVIASTARELADKAGGRKITKQYQDKKDGRVVWNGYVVGSRWFTAFKWKEVGA